MPDILSLDYAVTPFLKTLGDRFFRNITDENRANISADIHDLQTATDIAVEKALIDFLGSISPYPVLSEESDKGDKEGRRRFAKEKAYWVTDPIDGTAYFRNLEYGEFGTLLALVVNGKVVAGWGYFPGEKAEDDIMVKSVTPDAVTINDMPTTRTASKEPIGQFGISKHAFDVTEEERRILATNKKAAGLEYDPRPKYHSIIRYAQGKLDYYVYIGSYPWDFCVSAKIVEALGGRMYKFDRTRNGMPFEGDAILDHTMTVGVVLPRVDPQQTILPIFKNTAWEKTCV